MLANGAIDEAEIAALIHVWPQGPPALSNLAQLVGHVHSTTPMLSLVMSLLSANGVIAKPIVQDPEPRVVPFIEAAFHPERAQLVTAANWGGTYTSTVILPWPDT